MFKAELNFSRKEMKELTYSGKVQINGDEIIKEVNEKKNEAIENRKVWTIDGLEIFNVYQNSSMTLLRFRGETEGSEIYMDLITQKSNGTMKAYIASVTANAITNDKDEVVSTDHYAYMKKLDIPSQSVTEFPLVVEIDKEVSYIMEHLDVEILNEDVISTTMKKFPLFKKEDGPLTFRNILKTLSEKYITVKDPNYIIKIADYVAKCWVAVENPEANLTNMVSKRITTKNPTKKTTETKKTETTPTTTENSVGDTQSGTKTEEPVVHTGVNNTADVAEGIVVQTPAPPAPNQTTDTPQETPKATDTQTTTPENNQNSGTEKTKVVVETKVEAVEKDITDDIDLENITI